MFGLYSFDKGKPDPFEYIPVTTSGSPAANEAIVVGEMLKIASGKLSKAGADSDSGKPAYLAMQDSADIPVGGNLAVMRVDDDTVYETELSAAYSAIAVGAKVTLDSTATKITATTTKGIAQIVDWDGKAVGDKVRVRF